MKLNRYDIQLNFAGILGATSPPDVESIISTKNFCKRSDKELDARVEAGERILTPDELAERAKAERPESEEEEEQKPSAFKKDDKGLYIRPYEIKAHLRDAATIISRDEGEKGLRTRVAQTLFIVPTGYTLQASDPRIYIRATPGGPNDGIRTEPTGVVEIKGRVSGLRGPRSIISYVEVLEQPILIFDVLILSGSPVNGRLLDLFEMGSIKGFGGGRGCREWGRYTFSCEGS